MANIKGIDHVQLAAPPGCEEEAISFYGKILGLKELPKPENLRKRGGCWFECGNQQIHIGVEKEFSPARKAHPCFVVDRISQLKADIEQAGISVKEEVPIEGRTRFFVDDPFGNRIEFIQYD
ncbi:VOC family protein [Bacillus testis]|uniref:VOC family protein n=1 Tax=Bacillus testis TaxID=1622072 RepID=UPI00067F5B94|nr:VOC family protein [Bacillus testis]